MPTFKAFVSSTYEDLKDHRAHVIEALRRAGIFVDPMEEWTAASQEPKKLSTERLDNCQLCVLLVARRRGYVPDDESLSITQMEYEEALNRGAEVLVYMLSDDELKWDTAADERESDPDVIEWRKRLRARHVCSFFDTTPESIDVAPAITRWALGLLASGNLAGLSDLNLTLFWHLRPSTNAENFYGRQDQLEELDRHFEHGKTFVISAGPGIGKSRLAAEWSVRSGMNGFWTRGGGTIVQTLASLGRELGFEDATDDELSQRTTSWLSQNDSVLWVVDDLKDLTQVRELERVSGGAKLLVTTRSAEFGYLPDGAGRIALITLTPGASVDLLSSKIDSDGHDDVLKEIAEQVGYLPLALEMLAVRLGNNRLLGNQPGLLLEQLKEKPNTIELGVFQEEAKGASLPRDESVFLAISGTITELKESVREKLMPLGYMADAPLPQQLAMSLMGIEQGEFIEVIGECQRQSVLRLSDAGDALVVHSLTAAVIRSMDLGKSLGEASSRSLENLAERVNDYSIDLGTEVVHHVRMLEHIQAAEQGADPGEDRLSYASWLAEGYSRLGRYQDAVDLNEETLRLREKVLGPEHPDTLLSRGNLAYGYSDLGRYQEAVELHEETLGLHEKVLGPEHPNTLASRNNLAQGYSHLGRYQEAIELHQEILRLKEKVLGPEHFDTLLSRNNLAQGYSDLGRYREAVELHEETLRLSEKVLGSEHPYTLICRNNLAAGYSNLGRTEEAVELFEETLRLREKVLGPEHPDTLSSRVNLALGYSDLGRYQEAVDLGEETFRLQENVLGPEHPTTLICRNNLAQGYAKLGHNQMAVVLHEETLRLRERVLGPEHPGTLTSRNNLALGNFNLGRRQEAVELFEETLRLREKVLGPEHPNTLTSRNNLAQARKNRRGPSFLRRVLSLVRRSPV